MKDAKNIKENSQIDHHNPETKEGTGIIQEKKEINKSLWNGEICVDILRIPVRLYATVQEKQKSFRFLHRKDKQPIRYKKFCQAENTEIDSSDIVRGYEFHHNEYIIFDDNELVSLQIASSHQLVVDKFIPLYSINPIYYDKSYFLGPNGQERMYQLFILALQEKGKAGLGRLSWRNREYPVLLYPYQNVLITTILHYTDEVLSPTVVEKALPFQLPEKEELESTLTLIEKLAGEADLTKYRNVYQERLERLVIEKIEKRYITEPAKEKLVLEKVEEHYPTEPIGEEKEDIRSLVKSIQRSLADLQKKI